MIQGLEQVYTIADVATALQVSKKTVYTLLKTGELHGVKLVNRWRVRASDLSAYLDAKGRQKTTHRRENTVAKPATAHKHSQ